MWGKFCIFKSDFAMGMTAVAQKTLSQQQTMNQPGFYAASLFTSQPMKMIFFRDEYDSDATEASDEETRPFTRNELVGKAMKSVKKRETAMKKEGYSYDLSDAKEKTKKKDKKGKH